MCNPVSLRITHSNGMSLSATLSSGKITGISVSGTLYSYTTQIPSKVGCRCNKASPMAPTASNQVRIQTWTYTHNLNGTFASQTIDGPLLGNSDSRA